MDRRTALVRLGFFTTALAVRPTRIFALSDLPDVWALRLSAPVYQEDRIFGQGMIPTITLTLERVPSGKRCSCGKRYDAHEVMSGAKLPVYRICDLDFSHTNPPLKPSRASVTIFPRKQLRDLSQR